jgi:hypothetical protein
MAHARRIRRMKNLIVLSLVVFTACKSSEAADAVACDPAAADLAKQLRAANGITETKDEPADQAKFDAAKAEITGKRFAFKNCHVLGFGGDEVSFGATERTPMDCVMADGEDGTKKLQKRTREMNLDKLRVDVAGTVKMHGEKLKMTGCKITAHD